MPDEKLREWQKKAKAKLWPKIVFQGDCWIWTGRKFKEYGQLYFARATWKAYRLSYAAFVGEIPAGAHLDHLCHNPSCVNPRHLEPVTRRENSLRWVRLKRRTAMRAHIEMNPLSTRKSKVSVPDILRDSTKIKLLTKTNITSSCWLWTAGTDSHGYGMISVQRRKCYTHRVAYELFVGPIPAGLVLDHLCKVTLCLNPAHLEPVTWAENARRGRHTKLNQADVAAIRISEEPHTVVASRYGLHPSTVCDIRLGNRWNLNG